MSVLSRDKYLQRALSSTTPRTVPTAWNVGWLEAARTMVYFINHSICIFPKKNSF